jgi:hypothetical protein
MKVSARRTALVLVVIALNAGSCAAPKMRSTLDRRPSAEEMAQLWVKPANIASRDLFWGPGGEALAPKKDITYKVKAVDSTGASGGWDVEDPAGREYSVKIGDEAQTEVVASRLHWAVGYHQPATYLLTSYKLDNGELARTGRFRPKEDDIKVREDWPWHLNPFVGTREFKGLLVLELLINNWDIKTPQNKLYEVKRAGQPPLWYVVRDIGAAFGKTKWPVGTKNNPDQFESQNLIKRVGPNGVVEFDYHARHKELFKDITAEDVVWICELMNQITPKQYVDAFRAGAYEPATAERFIAKLRSKVQEGLNLRGARR